jgi:hypothetical protein
MRRAKLSVHMVAQKTAAVPEPLSDGERRDKLRAMLAQALAASNLAVDTDKLKAALEPVDLSLEQAPPPPVGDAAAAVEALGVRVKGSEGSEGSGSPEEARAALEAAGPALAKAWVDGYTAVRDRAKAEEAPPVKVALEPVWIEDGHAFRSRLEATCSVQPVRSVSDFEDTEPKL